jgi:hypothetical protein
MQELTTLYRPLVRGIVCLCCTIRLAHKSVLSIAKFTRPLEPLLHNTNAQVNQTSKIFDQKLTIPQEHG